jgi:cell wall assembly regulator SMI1
MSRSLNVRDAVLEMLRDPTLPPEDREPRGPVDPKAVERFEVRWGLSLPPAVREWLGVRNGAFIGYQVALGIETGEGWDIESTLQDLSIWRLRGWIPVAADGNGDYYVAASESSPEPDGVIFFIDQMDFERPAYVVGSDMWHFLYGLASTELRSEEWWPFDEGTMLALDPELALHPSLPMPWAP